MAFEVFAKGSAPASTVPSVTIQKRGLFSINDAAYRLLKEPEAVLFLWDAERRLIGLRGTSTDVLNAYPARRLSAPKKSKATGPVLIAGTMFTKFIDLDTTQAMRWVPKLQDDMLVIDLNTPGQTVVSNRGRGKVAQSNSERAQDPLPS
jgi:hypothetical protein